MYVRRSRVSAIATHSALLILNIERTGLRDSDTRVLTVAIDQGEEVFGEKHQSRYPPGSQARAASKYGLVVEADKMKDETDREKRRFS